MAAVSLPWQTGYYWEVLQYYWVLLGGTTGRYGATLGYTAQEQEIAGQSMSAVQQTTLQQTIRHYTGRHCHDTVCLSVCWDYNTPRLSAVNILVVSSNVNHYTTPTTRTNNN